MRKYSPLTLVSLIFLSNSAMAEVGDVSTPVVDAVAMTSKFLPKQPTPKPIVLKAKPTNHVTQYIIIEINKYRASLGLNPVQTSDETCDFAKIRAKEISSNFSHDGFRDRRNANILPYAHWSDVTENLAMTSDYKKVVILWKNSPGHAKNMRADTPFVCVVEYNKYFAYEAMKP